MFNSSKRQENANQTIIRYQLSVIGMVIIQKITNSVCKAIKETLCTIGGNVNWYSHYEKEYGSFLQNWKDNDYNDKAIWVYIQKDEIMISERYMSPTSL